MDFKQLQNKLDEIISNHNVSKETLSLLLEIKNDLNTISTDKDRVQIYLKWISIFKDASYIFTNFKDFF